MNKELKKEATENLGRIIGTAMTRFIERHSQGYNTFDLILEVLTDANPYAGEIIDRAFQKGQLDMVEKCSKHADEATLAERKRCTKTVREMFKDGIPDGSGTKFIFPMGVGESIALTIEKGEEV